MPDWQGLILVQIAQRTEKSPVGGMGGSGIDWYITDNASFERRENNHGLHHNQVNHNNYYHHGGGPVMAQHKTNRYSLNYNCF